MKGRWLSTTLGKKEIVMLLLVAGVIITNDNDIIARSPWVAMAISTTVFLKIFFEHFFYSSTHNDNAY
jgi:hypothetical protein